MDRRANKMEEAKKLEVYEEGAFDGMELEISKPILNKDNVPVVSSNFEDMANKIKAVVAKYKDTKLTADNVNYVKTLKSHFVSLRTSIGNARKEWEAMYINPMKTTVTSMCNDLIDLASEGENVMKSQLEVYDQERKDQLTVILEDYKAEAVIKYDLRPEYADKLVFKKNYYNLTQKEDDTIEDIEEQAKELAKEQNDYDNAVELITSECEDTHLLADTYIRQLEYKSPMELILMIKSDKKKAEEMEASMKEQEETTGKIEIGVADNKLTKAIEEATKIKEDEVRERIMRVRYTAKQASLMNKFFKENDIFFEFIKE